MPATLSVEGKLDAGLRELGCASMNFVNLSKTLGVQVSTGVFSEALSGKRYLNREVGDRLLEILERMKSLQSEVDVPIDWAITERISNALTTRLVAAIDRESNSENSELQQMAIKVTKSFQS